MPPITQAPPSSLLRYEEIADELREQIASGILQPGSRLPTVREIRRTYNVTQATVERALAVLEKESLITRAHRNGVFVADPGHRPLTGVIGFYGVGFTQSNFSPYWTHLVAGVEEALQEHDAQLLLLNAVSPSGWNKVDGVLFNGAIGEIPRSWMTPETPGVSFFLPPIIGDLSRDEVLETYNISLMLPDDRSGMYQATKHLLELGHRKIAYLNNSKNNDSFFARRVAGYRDALAEYGVEPDPRWLRALPYPSPQLYFMNAARESMKNWLNEDWASLGCTALLAHNDDAAWGAVEAFREAGIDVPRQVSVVGYDGTEVAQCCNPILATVDVPLKEMGRLGVETLWRRMNGENCEKEILVPVTSRVGGSTARV